jgi:SH3-like domain-containing protein
MRKRVLFSAATALAVVSGGALAQDRTKTPSGLPVPRYVSLKFTEVNARSGPSEDHRISWTYGRRGLPVEITAETEMWRRIRDPDGSQAWVHKRTLDGRRTAMVRGAPRAFTPLRRSPEADAPVVAEVQSNVIGQLEECRDGWCRLQVGRREGWIPAASLWGVDPDEARAAS